MKASKVRPQVKLGAAVMDEKPIVKKPFRPPQNIPQRGGGGRKRYINLTTHNQESKLELGFEPATPIQLEFNEYNEHGTDITAHKLAKFFSEDLGIGDGDQVVLCIPGNSTLSVLVIKVLEGLTANPVTIQDFKLVDGEYIPGRQRCLQDVSDIGRQYRFRNTPKWDRPRVVKI
jgi:hypothetical protein